MDSQVTKMWKTTVSKNKDAIELRATFKGNVPLSDSLLTHNFANVLITVYENYIVVSQNGKWEMTFEQFDEAKEAIKAAGLQLHYMIEDIKKSKCIVCKKGPVTESVKTDNFQYGAGEDAMILSANVPVLTCDACGTSWSDQRAIELRENEVRKLMRSRGIQLCVVCQRVPVDVDEGFDTCSNCIRA